MSRATRCGCGSPPCSASTRRASTRPARRRTSRWASSRSSCCAGSTPTSPGSGPPPTAATGSVATSRRASSCRAAGSGSGPRPSGWPCCASAVSGSPTRSPAAGYDVIGDPADLRPPVDVPERRHPDSVTDAELVAAATGVIAEMMSDVRRLTREVRAPAPPPPRPRGARRVPARRRSSVVARSRAPPRRGSAGACERGLAAGLPPLGVPETGARASTTLWPRGAERRGCCVPAAVARAAVGDVRGARGPGARQRREALGVVGRVVAEIDAWPGTAVMSHEFFAAASAEQAARAVARLAAPRCTSW